MGFVDSMKIKSLGSETTSILLDKISKVSDQTKKFIQGCLEVDENKRYSMDEVFLHPLF